MRLTDNRLSYIELFLLLLLVVLQSGIALLFFYISSGLAVFSLVFELSFLAFALLYVVPDRRPDGEGAAPRLLHALFSIAIFSFIMSILTSGAAYPGLMVKLLTSIQTLGLWLVLFIPLFFLAFTGVYFLRKEHGSETGTKLLLLASVLFILILYYFFIINGALSADDEELLKLVSVQLLLNGSNPYATSISLILYQHTSSIGATLTAGNTLLGTMDYPSLFFLASAPFYFIAKPVIYNLVHVYMPAQFVVFLFVLLVTFAYLMKQKQLMRPQLTLLLLFVLSATELSSITTYLMLALLLLAYAKIESKYAWLFLGLCLSIQQELWLPVLFLLVYSLNTYGIRAGARNAVGALAVFLAFNAYFILLSPSAYFGSIFGTLNQPILPFNPSPFAFFMLSSYQLPLASYSLLFEAIAVFLLLVFLYLNKKELIPLFSLIPFLVLDHILVSYYAFFLFLFIFAIATSDGARRRGIVEMWLRKHRAHFFLAVSAAALLIIGFVAASHNTYQRNFDITATNQTLFINTAGSSTILNSRLAYHNMSNDTLYVFAFKYAGISAGFSGLINQSIISNPQACLPSDYRCLINVNKIMLPNSSGVYPLSLRINWSKDNGEVSRAAVALYNSSYFYVSGSIGNSSG